MAAGQQLGQRCKRDHDDWIFTPDGHKRCRTCRNMRRNNTYNTDLTPGYRGPLGVKCKRDHDYWYVDRSGRKRCWTCKNGNPASNWASRRIDADGRRHHDTGAPTTLLWDTLTYSEVMKAREPTAA